MATRKKITRKEIRQPDEFLTLSARAIEFVQAHTREIAIGIGALLVAGLLFWAGSAYTNRREAKAAHLLAQAQALLHPAPDAREGEPDPAAEGKADPEAESGAVALLEDLVENYKRTEASGTARILLAQRYYEAGNIEGAIETYKRSLKRGNRKAELKAMAWEGLAYAYEAEKDFQQALGWYEKLSRSSLTHFQGWAYLGMARCYEKLGENRKAIDAYRSLLAEHPQHPWAPEAQASIARITQSLEAENTPEALPTEEPREAQKEQAGKDGEND